MLLPERTATIEDIFARAMWMLREARTDEAPFEFAVPEEGVDIADDYATLALTLRRHLIALRRAPLGQWMIRTADDPRRNGRDGQTVRTSGIGAHRQQASTSVRVIFVTLEDEMGTVNIVVWPGVAEAQRAVRTGAKLLSVKGKRQADKGVCTLVALQMVVHTALLTGLRVASQLPVWSTP